MELKGDLLFLRVSHRVYQASVQWMRDTLESLIVNLLRPSRNGRQSMTGRDRDASVC